MSVVAVSLIPVLVAGVSALAVIAAFGTIAILLNKRENQLERRLAGYSSALGDSTSGDAGGDSLTDTKLVQQAAEMAARFAQHAGVLDRVRVLLEQAELPIRPAEALLFWPVIAIFASGFGYALFGSIIFAGIFLAAGTYIPYFLVKRMRRKRLRSFEDQLPDTLNLLAGSLRAGFSFIQGMEAVANETVDPMRKELQRVFTEARLGRPIEEALEEVATRMSSDDLRWAVMAIRIQREVGGNLSELLDTVSETMVQRDRLRREIRSLTAEGRMSGVVLSVFPPGFALMLFLFQRDYMSLLLNDLMGVIALVVASLLAVAGWFWLKKIVNIEV